MGRLDKATHITPVCSEKSRIDVEAVQGVQKNGSNGLCHATRHKVVLVLKELLRTTRQEAQSNYFVCLSNMKATLSADILQLGDKTLEKGLGKTVFILQETIIR